MSVDDHRLIGNLWGVSLVVDNAMQTIIQDMILPDREPDLSPGLLGEVGRHLVRVVIVVGKHLTWTWIFPAAVMAGPVYGYLHVRSAKTPGRGFVWVLVQDRVWSRRCLRHNRCRDCFARRGQIYPVTDLANGIGPFVDSFAIWDIAAITLLPPVLAGALIMLVPACVRRSSLVDQHPD